MKKKFHLIIYLVLIININGCSGYKPIYSSTNFKFEIADYSLSGDKRIGNQIYNRLNNISKFNKNNADIRSIKISLNVTKDKSATVKNNAGKILEYKMYISTDTVINDYLTNEEILRQNISYDASYKVQSQHSETIKLQNKILDNLIIKTYENLLTKINENISEK